MKKEKVIVGISASYEKRGELFLSLKKYAKHSDDRFAYFDEFAFSTDILPEYDAFVIFNTPQETIRAFCHPENIIAFMMEPGVPGEHPWMFRELGQYYNVYSPINQSENTILSHGFLGWYFTQDYNYLKQLSLPEKTRSMSCIASALHHLPGHLLRRKFVKTLQQEIPGIDFFGKGLRYLPDKMEGLLPYRYSIAVENTSQPYYFTEKINDCFLTYTVPLYYGCRNISRYFPKHSYIEIDIEKPAEAIQKIQSVMTNDDWSTRIEALKEARELVLSKYQPLAGAAEIFRQKRTLSARKKVTLKPVEYGLLKRIKSSLYKPAKS